MISSSAWSPTPTPTAFIIALLTLRARRPPPDGITFEVKSAAPIATAPLLLQVAERLDVRPGTPTTASPVAVSGAQYRITLEARAVLDAEAGELALERSGEPTPDANDGCLHRDSPGG